MTLVPVTYTGGIYRHDEIIDLIEDLGGYIIQKHVIAQEVVLQCLVPDEDIPLIELIAKPLTGSVKTAPLVGTEIAVVSPSLEYHHLPHTSCDVAEYLRRSGAKTNMVGLSRGFGKRIANLSLEERDIINEHDLAIYVLGNFAECIGHKLPVLRRGVTVPVVVTGAPDREALMEVTEPPAEGYVGGIGRIMHRWRRPEELEKLDELVGEVAHVLDRRREEIADDPLSVSPARLMEMIMDHLPSLHGSTHPTPVTVQIAGLRVKLPYDESADAIRGIECDEGASVGEICDLIPSRMRNYIWIRIKPYSETGIMV